MSSIRCPQKAFYNSILLLVIISTISHMSGVDAPCTGLTGAGISSIISVDITRREITGCSKTYMAYALGIEACKQYYNIKYVHLPDLLINLEIAKSDGNYKKVMAKYANHLILILNE